VGLISYAPARPASVDIIVATPLATVRRLMLSIIDARAPWLGACRASSNLERCGSD
jgi:hypothetical protein